MTIYRFEMITSYALQTHTVMHNSNPLYLCTTWMKNIMLMNKDEHNRTFSFFFL